MTNRLRNILRALPFCVGLCLSFLPTEWLKAQPAFFNFSYNGPTTLSVGPNCSSMLQGNVPDPVVSSTVGATITMSMFDETASTFNYADLFTSGTTAHVYWFVKDNAGHSHTYEYFINFVDNSPPTFNLAGVFDTLEFSSVVQVPTQTALPVTDNCTPVTNQTFSETAKPDTCQTGTITRTWTATDANNNTATFVQTIIIYRDSLPPQITGYPQNGSAPCELLTTAYPNWLANQISIFAATDASGVASLTNNGPASFPPGCKEPLMVRFKAVDNCQFQINVDVIFTTSDTEGPVVIKAPKDTVAYCSQSDNELIKLREWISTKAYSQVFDSCSYPLTYTMEIGGALKDSAQVEAAFLASFAAGCSTQSIGSQSYDQVHGRVSVKFIVTDDCGNSTTMGVATFGAIDTLPPVLSGVNVTEQCGGGNDQTALQAWINAHGNMTVVEDCSNFTWTNFSFVTSTGQVGDGNFNSGPYPTVQANNCSWFANVTFRATDDCGNSSTHTLRWTIIDTQVPTFTGLQPTITVYCPNPLPTVPAATVSDNCDANVSVTFSRMYKDSICDGSYTVRTTWTAMDDCGNSTSVVQDILVRDTTKPVFVLIPANKTFRCDTFVLPAIPMMGVDVSATDLCSPVLSITTATVSFQNPDPAVCGHYSYNIVRTFTAMDECNNTQTAIQTLSVVDNLGPVPGGILDTTTLCSALTPFPAPIPLATDACSGLTAAPTTTGQTTTPGTCTDRYTISVQWVATDVCGNTTGFNQLVHVIDTVAPTLSNIPANITVECDAIPAPPEISILNAADNCDNSASVNLVQTEIRSTDPDSCAYWTDYIIKREWTVTDNCGNAKTYTQLIQIEDTTPPAVTPPADMMFSSDLGNCGAEVWIPAPLSITDVCSDQNVSVVLRDTAFLMLPVGAPSSAVVDTVTFQWTPPNLPPLEPVLGSASLNIFIDGADAEGLQEFFIVYGESGPSLTNTASTITQCASSTTNVTIPANLLNAWMSDGILTLKLVPVGVNISACPTALNRVRANIAYTYHFSEVPIALQYSLDGGATQAFPPAGTTYLTTGTHTVVYTATDCAGNSATTSVQISVNDTQAPSIATPSNLTAFTGQNNCEGSFTLPFPNITENCAMSANLSLASAVMPLHFEMDPDAGIVASDIFPMLTGIIPNAVGVGTLKIRHKGDNAQLGEFFTVFDEGGSTIGMTNQGTMLMECSTFFETEIQVSAATINNWANVGGAPGSASFYLESNKNPSSPDFISNCAALLPNGTDGISQVQIVLEYSYAVVDYSIKNAANQVVSSGIVTGIDTRDTLSPGNYTVMYTTTDNAGLTGMTSFSVTVRDTVKPKAICQPTLTIFVNPAGAPQYTLSPVEINNGSSDNCTPSANLFLGLTPNIFNCNQAGSNFNVTMTVRDTSGNTSNCTSIVRVETQKPFLDYTPVCEGGELRLFCFPPTAAPNTYTYQWTGPNNFSSSEQNPIVTSNAMAIHNGTYCITITGATGCTASACQVVNLAILAITPVLNSNGVFSYCPGQNVVLKTDSYTGQNVSYQWLVDSPTGLMVLGDSPTPTYSVTNLAPGNYTFYVKVFANGCNTALSNAVLITMHPTPPAAVAESALKVCEGLGITLTSTTPTVPGLTYMWSHPNGWTSNAQIPTVTNNAVKAQHQGIYTLITQQNGCLSAPVTVTVTVDSMPGRPSISGNPSLCEGQPLTLVCSNLNAAQYVWTVPGGGNIITSINSISIPSVTVANAGAYTVLVSSNGCFSNESLAFQVGVHPYPDVVAGSNAPICKDSLLQLTASFSSTVPLTWCWTFPDGSLKYLQNLTVPNGASGSYIVVGKTSFGCSDSDTIQVTNSTPPIISSISNNAPTCCDGTTDAVLSATVTPAPFSYSWTGPAAFGTSNLASPVIPDVCTPFNGTYTLVVKDAFGCPSLPATTAINIQAPPVTPVLTVSQQPVCAGATVTLTFTNSTQGATYVWDRPGSLSDTTTLSTTLTIPNAQPWHSGNYRVRAIAANGLCQSALSNTVTVTVHPIPPTPVVSSNSPVCEGAEIELYGPTIAGASYFWTGPLGFSDPTEDPSRMPATLGMSGQYRLFVKVNNCSSGSDSTLVTVVANPAQPVIALNAPAAICMDVPVTEFLNVFNPVNGMVYSWKETITNVVLQTSTASSLNLGMANVLALGAGSHTFQVTAITPGTPSCNSIPSLPITIKFDTIPAGINAYAGEDRPACISSTAIPLMATPPAGNVTGMWSQIPPVPATVTFDNAGSPNATFEANNDTVYLFQWSLSNGACMNYDHDTVQITTNFPEVAMAMADTVFCSPLGVQLHATQGIVTQGVWTQRAGQTQIGVVIQDPNDPNTYVNNLLNGQNYAFYWQIGNPGCGVSEDEVKVFIYSPKPNAGAVQFVCDNQNCANLSASALESFETGLWTSNTGLSFTNPGSANTTVCGLKPGKNEIFWTINNGKCGDQSRDTVEVFFELAPTPFNDSYQVAFGDTLHFDVKLNDILPADIDFTVLTPPSPGALIETLGEGIFVYRPQSGFSGTDATMTYQVCNTNCPDKCFNASVTFVVAGAKDCFIPSIITPNEDGLNDEFIIPQECTLGEGAADLEVTIFNQWGDVVFHQKPYLNDWKGTYNSEELPAGTYYYVVKLNPDVKPLNGFLLIQR